MGESGLADEAQTNNFDWLVGGLGEGVSGRGTGCERMGDVGAVCFVESGVGEKMVGEAIVGKTVAGVGETGSGETAEDETAEIARPWGDCVGVVCLTASVWKGSGKNRDPGDITNAGTGGDLLGVFKGACSGVFGIGESVTSTTICFGLSDV